MTADRAGQLAQPSDLVDVAHLVTAYYTTWPDLARPRAAGRLRHLRPPRLQPDGRVQRGPHRRDHAGDLRLPHGAGNRGPAVHRARHARPLRARLGHRPRGARRERRRRCSSTAGTGTRRRPPSRTRSSRTTGARRRRRLARRRHRRHALAQPARRRRLQVQPAERRPGRHRRHRLDRRTRQRAPRGRPAGRPAGAARARPRRGDDATGTTSSTPTSATCPHSSTSTPIREAGLRIGADPLGGAQRRLLGRDRRALPARPHRRQPARRPDLAVHDARLGRQDPDGSVVALGDGLARRPPGRVQASPPGTTPTPTGTASSRPTPG